MKIAIFTNTYLPHVGGVANSVATLVEGMRERGHAVLVFAPEFKDQPEDEKDVVRIPSIQNFNGTDFSYRLPSGTRIGDHVRRFQPDLIHCHHPFLLGDAGMRMAHQWNVPLVFTHHTRYEDYVHYVLEDAEWLRNLASELATEYANLCDAVIAPSGSIEKLIQERGVTAPVKVIPTGIDYDRFRKGDGAAVRKSFGIPEDAFLVGHVGRLAEEKNLRFLMDAVLEFLRDSGEAHFLVVGTGESLDDLKDAAAGADMKSRVHFLGKQTKQDLVNAYHAMDVFAFASKSETQGMVIAEAMAAGIPVVALDASGVRDILKDRENGRMLPEDETESGFAKALSAMKDAIREEPGRFDEAIEASAKAFSTTNCLDRLEGLYRDLIEADQAEKDTDGWTRFTNRIEAEWEIAVSRARAVGAVIKKKTAS